VTNRLIAAIKKINHSKR